MIGDHVLRLAFAANVLILTPTFLALLRGSNTVFEGKIANVDGLRHLMASVWFAILCCSVAGVLLPRPFEAVLVVQVIYKASFLAIYVLPLLMRQQPERVPWGLTTFFLAVIVTWPIVLWTASLPDIARALR